MLENTAPWHDEQAADWLGAFGPWKQMVRQVRTTLESEARNNPHEIRAAASFVILFCREGVWPNFTDPMEGSMVLDLARRQLSIVRQMFALEGRSNKKLMANPNYKTLLKSLEEEIRVLDSRISDEDVVMKNQPPASWGEFLGKRTERRNVLD